MQGLQWLAAFGIRCADDLNCRYSECIIGSADLLNTQLAHRGLSFFFDAIDVDQQAIGGMHCEDVFGWLLRTASSRISSRFGLRAMTGSLKVTTASAQTGKTETASCTRSSTASFLRRPTDKAAAVSRFEGRGVPQLYAQMRLMDYASLKDAVEEIALG